MNKSIEGVKVEKENLLGIEMRYIDTINQRTDIMKNQKMFIFPEKCFIFPEK